MGKILYGEVKRLIHEGQEVMRFNEIHTCSECGKRRKGIFLETEKTKKSIKLLCSKCLKRIIDWYKNLRDKRLY
jgi:hypothetical protein